MKPRLRVPRLLVPRLLLPLVLSFLGTAPAQQLRPRLSGPIDIAQPVVLPHSRTPRALPSDDLGPVPPSTPLEGITLVFKRSSEQEADLQALLARLQDPASPDFHQWLSPDTFAARFGIADADLDSTTLWLRDRGFTHLSIGPSRDRITFSGTAAQVGTTFHTELHHFRSVALPGEPTELHLAPATDLTLPAPLAAITAAVLHLSDFRPKSNVILNPAPRPTYTAVATQSHFLDPLDLAIMYDLKSVYTAGFTGKGQSLAVVGQSYVDPYGQISTFQTYLGHYNRIYPVLIPGTGVQAISPGDLTESEIDLEYTSGIAPDANIFLVYVGANPGYNVFDALTFAIQQNIAPVISISYGLCEALISSTELNAGNALFAQAAAQGQTLIASSGDHGSNECGRNAASSSLPTTQQQALSVPYPASSPWVTAVGGTEFAAGSFEPGSSALWATATTYDAPTSLLAYPPEVVWNEDSAISSSAAGGGGSSAQFPRPSWQSNLPGIPPGNFRLLPDVALQASIHSPGFLLCASSLSPSQPSTCVNGVQNTNHQYSTAGGTSFSAPVLAGAVTLLNQMQNASGQGSLNAVLYALARTPATYSAAFHDILSGTIACTPGGTGCSAPGQSGFAAAPGYDLATGLGSLDFARLFAAWPAPPPTTLLPTITVAGVFGNPITDNASVLTTIGVSSVNAPSVANRPTGSVSVSVDGVVLAKSVPFDPNHSTNGAAGLYYDLNPPFTNGSHIMKVTYSGDADHSPSATTTTFITAHILASGGLTLTTPAVTLPQGGSITTPITITPTGGYNGRVVWSISATSNGTTGGSFCYSILPALVPGVVTTAKLNLGSGASCTSAPASTKVVVSHQPSTRSAATPPRPPVLPLAATLLALCATPLFPRRRRSLPPLLLLLLSALLGLGLSGCGGSSNSSTTPPTITTPTNPASYTITLKASDSVNTDLFTTSNFTLTVQ